MLIIRVPIVRWVSDDQPGFVECLLVDAHGKEWRFVDKLPIFYEKTDVDKNCEYPQPSVIACEIVSEKIDGDGRKIFVVNTEKPSGIEAVDETTQFEVLPEQIEEIARE